MTVREVAPPSALFAALGETIVGQRHVLEALVYALIGDGHVLLEGPPGLAKTLACRALAAAVAGNFKRVQFTPDLLPSDIVGTRVFDQKTGEFTTVLGPIFAHVVLADEINRAPAKVQSALLECMQEGQVTIGPETHRLPEPFIVMATMNPLDAEGTYALPLAQMDRFLLKELVGYPDMEEELRILERFGGEPRTLQRAVISLEHVVQWRHEARQIYVDGRVARYAALLVRATRACNPYFERGASPRATLALIALARARAFCEGRSYVLPDDVKAVAPAALRHRIALNYRVSTEGLDPERLIADVISGVPVP
ncbi:MAG: AAA family ATPase [Candidatus Eremiobacteraeota bacterium]|nr:AAA family ATPase [Candidatus Eremiobacteraeota bacterium]